MRIASALSLCLLLASYSVASAENTAAPATPSVAEMPSGLESTLTGSWRAPENVARDTWRHPAETLTFFGVNNTMTVVEITPGGGWYTEILAPWLRGKGQYIGAIINPASARSDGAKTYYTNANDALRNKLAAMPSQYDQARLIEFDISSPQLGAADSADAVLTFRNVHNWMSTGTEAAMFSAFFAVLKPGGVLGVVEHRANADVPAGDRSGYVSEAQVIAMATAAGFVLEARSEINANPADTKNHPNGVWSLPPGNRHDAADAARYQAIGESDRMTLRFRKPA